jgi:hypothetical protein
MSFNGSVHEVKFSKSPGIFPNWKPDPEKLEEAKALVLKIWPPDLWYEATIVLRGTGEMYFFTILDAPRKVLPVPLLASQHLRLRIS